MPTTLRKPIALASALALALALVPAAALAAPDDAPAADGLADRSILLTLEDSPEGALLSTRALSASAGGEALEGTGLAVEDAIQVPGAPTVLVAEAAEGQPIEEAVAAAEELPGVAAAQPNYFYKLIEGVEDDGEMAAPSGGLATERVAQGVNDPYANLRAPSATSPNQYWLYNAHLADAWPKATSDGAVSIAVLDSGIRLNHEDLSANIRYDLAYDSYNNRPLSASQHYGGDNGGHGTHVAGIASATANNGRGVAGGAFNAKIVPVKVVNDLTGNKRGASTGSICRGYAHLLDAVDEGRLTDLRVVNISLGSYSQAMNDPLMHALISIARDDYGIVTVCAGGNDGVTDVSYPSDYDECVAVTALQPDGRNIPWSDYNRYKDISAPGEDVWSTYAASDSSYEALSGTSMAAPVVSGAFALLFAAVPGATVDEACNALYKTADPIVDPVNDRTRTSGTHGALNASAAIDYLRANDVKRFSDVGVGDWYYEAVNYAVKNGIVNGYAGTDRFGAHDATTREQAASILYNYRGNGTLAPAAPQGDVQQGQWYDKGVNWAVSTGTMSGYAGTDRFGIGDSLTREQIACIVANASGADTSKASPAKFQALKGTEQTSAYARQNVIWAVDAGIINGVDNGDGTRSLAPGKTVSRAEMAAIVGNAIKQGLL